MEDGGSVDPNFMDLVMPEDVRATTMEGVLAKQPRGWVSLSRIRQEAGFVDPDLQNTTKLKAWLLGNGYQIEKKDGGVGSVGVILT